jgi:hypothetical protein
MVVGQGARKRILDPHAGVVLAVAEVLGEDEVTA